MCGMKKTVYFPFNQADLENKDNTSSLDKCPWCASENITEDSFYDQPDGAKGMTCRKCRKLFLRVGEVNVAVFPIHSHKHGTKDVMKKRVVNAIEEFRENGKTTFTLNDIQQRTGYNSPHLIMLKLEELLYEKKGKHYLINRTKGGVKNE